MTKKVKSTKNMSTPKVPKDASSGFKYGTGETGRAKPPQVGKKHTKPGNP